VPWLEMRTKGDKPTGNLVQRRNGEELGRGGKTRDATEQSEIRMKAILASFAQ
jgi:hypothetical protein